MTLLWKSPEKNKMEVPPTDVVLLLDVSNSMSGNRFELAKSAASQFVTQLMGRTENLNIGVVTFSSSVHHTLPLTTDADAVTSFIQAQNVNTSGVTFIQATLIAAETMLAEDQRDINKTIVLLSDGGATKSYKASSMAANTGEIASYDGISSDYILSDFDLNTIVGTGNHMDLLTTAYQINNTIILDNIIPTISEILDFKAGPKHSVYVLGVELSGDEDLTWNYRNKNITRNGIEYEAYGSWTEEVKDGVLSPGEEFSFKVDYVNNTAVPQKVAAAYYNPPTTHGGKVLQDYILEYNNDSLTPIKMEMRDAEGNTLQTASYPFSRISNIYFQATDANTSSYAYEIPPGGSYSLTVTLHMKPFQWFENGYEPASEIQMMNLGKFRFSCSEFTGRYERYCFNHSYSREPMIAPGSQYNSKEDVEFLMKNLSSDGIEGSTYFDVADVNDLVTIMNNDLFNNMVNHIQNGKLLGTFESNAEGTIIVKNLSNGDYYFVESKAPDGYIPNDGKHEFTIQNLDVNLYVKNRREGGIFTDEHTAYIIGYPDETVRPTRDISRAEVSTVFFRMLQDEVRSANWTQDNPYPDVTSQYWYNNAISVMNEMEIVTGYPDGRFKPNGSITRAEMATIAARFVESQGTPSLSNKHFNDTQGHWAEDYIRKAASVGWIEGYKDGSFRPEQNITRAEFMTMTNRMLERAPELESDLLSDMLTWSDNMDKSQWYYLDVQEATSSHDYDRKDTVVPGRSFHYETWTKLLPIRDWSQLEHEWSSVNS